MKAIIEARWVPACQIVRTANATQIQMIESYDGALAMSGKNRAEGAQRLTFEYISCATASESSQWQTISALIQHGVSTVCEQVTINWACRAHALVTARTCRPGPNSRLFESSLCTCFERSAVSRRCPCHGHAKHSLPARLDLCSPCVSVCGGATSALRLRTYHPLLDAFTDLFHPPPHAVAIARRGPGRRLQRRLQEDLHVCPEELCVELLPR